MSTSLTVFPENDKIDGILSRIDEMKRLLRTFRGYLNESCQSFDGFGKSVNKTLKLTTGLLGSANNDPNITYQLSSKFSNFENSSSKHYSQQFNDFNNTSNQILDDTMDRIESARRRIFDNSTIAIKNLGMAKTNYVKIKSKYERACKDAEAALYQRKKPTGDALKAYSLRNARKLNDLAKTTMRHFLASESQLKEAIDTANSKQFGFNAVMQDSLNTFKLLCHVVLEKVILVMQKSNETLNGMVQAFEEDPSLKQIQLEDFARSTTEQEDEYIEERRPQDLITPKGIYLRIVKLANEDPDGIQDLHLQLFADAASKHIDTASLIIEERMKLMKSFKGLFTDIALQNETLSKAIQKIAKNSPVSGTTSTVTKYIADCVNKYYNVMDNLAKKYSNFSNFLNLKSGTLDAAVKELNSGAKAYQNASQKALKDHAQARNNYLNGLLGLEKASKRLSDAEKEKNENRVTLAKLDLEESQSSIRELKQILKNSMIEAVNVLKKTYTDYLDFEFARVKGAISVIEVTVMHQKNTITDFQECIKATEESYKIEAETLDDEVDRLIEQDEKIHSYFKLASASLSNARFAFTQIFIPPPDVLNQLKLSDEKEESATLPDKDDVREEQLQTEEDKEEAESMPVIQMDKDGEKVQGIPEDLKEKFGLGPKDKFVTEFSCALKQNILQQGWLYVLTTKICYYSVFSTEILVIPVSDIQSVEKRVNALIFDNAIAIKTPHGEIVFASFFSRDKAHQLLARLVKDPASIEADIAMRYFAESTAADEQTKRSEELARKFEEESRRNEEIIRKIEEETRMVEASQERLETEAAARKPSRSQESSPVRKPDNLMLDTRKPSSSITKLHERAPIRARPGKDLFDEAASDVVQNSNEKNVAEGTERINSHHHRRAHSSMAEESKHEAPSESIGASNQIAEVDDSVSQFSTETLQLEELPKEPEFQLQPEDSAKLTQRQERIMQEANPRPVFDNEMLKTIFENCTVLDLYRAAFTDEALITTQKEEPNSKVSPWLAFHYDCEDSAIEAETWAPSVPEFFQKGELTKESLEELLNHPSTSKRTYKFTHPMREQSMFVPKACLVEEIQTIFWLSNDELIVQSECYSSKVPLTDTFKVNNCYHLKQLPGNTASFTWTFGIEFIKTTMFKGKISRAALDEAHDVARSKLAPIITKHLDLVKVQKVGPTIKHKIIPKIKTKPQKFNDSSETNTPIRNQSPRDFDSKKAASETVSVSSEVSSPETITKGSSHDTNGVSKAEHKLKDIPQIIREESRDGVSLNQEDSNVSDTVELASIVQSVSNPSQEVRESVESNKAQILRRRQESSQAVQEEVKDEIWDVAPMDKQDLFINRKESLYRQMVPLDKYPDEMHLEILENCTVPDVFRAIFSDHPVKCRGKTFSTPWFAVKLESGETNIMHSQWNPPAPTIFSKSLISNATIGELREYDPISRREYKYVHPVRDQSMFAPKYAGVVEKHTIYWLSFDELVVQTELQLSKVPFADSFVVKNCYQLKQVDATRTQLHWKGWVDFTKSFMFKTRVHKSTMEENEEFKRKTFLPIIRENMRLFQERKKSAKDRNGDASSGRSLKNTTRTRPGISPSPSPSPTKTYDISGSPSPVRATSKSAGPVIHTGEEVDGEVEEDEEEEVEVEVDEPGEGGDFLTDSNVDLLRKRADRLRGQCLPGSKFTTPIFKETFNGGIFEAFNAIFAESEVVSSKGVKYKNPWDQLRTQIGDTELQPDTFKPQIPTYFKTGERSEAAINELLNYAAKSEKNTSFTHPVTGQGMFAPKICGVMEKYTAYWLSHEELIVQLEVSTKGVPFCDTFVTRINYHYKQIEANKCSLEYAMLVDFSKNPMFKGKILKAATDENVETGQTRIVPTIKENIPFFAKIKAAVSVASPSIKTKKIVKRKKAGTKAVQKVIKPEEIKYEEEYAERKVSYTGSDYSTKKASIRVPSEQASEDLVETTRETSRVVNELKDKLSAVEGVQSTLVQEVKMLRMILFVIIALNLMMIALSWR